MKVNEIAAAATLSKLGLTLVFVDKFGHLGFSRPATGDPEFYETLEISHAGRQLDAVSATVGLSCIQGRFAWRGLVKRQCIIDIATDKERGETEIKTPEDAKAWLARVVSTAEAELSTLRAKRFSVLKTETLHARAAALAYLKKLGYPCSAQAAKTRLSAQAPEEAKIDANLVLSAGIGWQANPLFDYLAVLTVLTYSPAIEEHAIFNLADPANDTEFMWRVKIIADRLLCFPRPSTLILEKDGGFEFRSSQIEQTLE